MWPGYRYEDWPMPQEVQPIIEEQIKNDNSKCVEKVRGYIGKGV